MTAQGQARYMGSGEEVARANLKLCSGPILGNVIVHIMEHTF